MYGWIAVNYLKGALCHAPHKVVLGHAHGTFKHIPRHSSERCAPCTAAPHARMMGIRG